MLTYPFGRDNNGDILYTRYFKNEIYTVSSNEMRIKYSIDFGPRTLKQLEDVTDEYEALQLFNLSNHKASFLSNVYEDEKSVAFFFIMKVLHFLSTIK